jgi:translation initiation factor IF-2
MRTKESRENRDRGVNKNKNSDHDKLGSKRQERFVNLEKNGGKRRPQTQPSQPKEEESIKSITLPEHMTIKELADKMKIQASAIVKKLFLKGQMVTVNQEVDYEKAEEIALEFNCIAEQEVKIDVIAELLKEEEEDASALVARPPVVCVMGHVDHGKTSLLDAIRNTHVTDREAGGITQHIGAYVVSINGQKITFLDTPGHEAFTAMRMRGAKATDIAILVVAADDGVMPQTIEAINHAKAAGIEIIVAINKIDKPNANIDRVKQELSEYELIPEDWGGSTIFAPVSAHTHEGIDNLLEMILLTAEVAELKANPKRQARGVIIEAQLDKGRGAVATALVQKGTLRVGDSIACGSAYGKVRAMIDDKGRRLKEAGPSVPVEILGLSSVPDAGETIVACETEKDARSFAETYISEGKEKLLEETRSRMTLDDLFSQIKAGNVKELDIIVKADVQGSVEAVKQSLVKLSNEEVVVKIIHGGVGAINESDVILASASNAIIIGFNVRPDPTAKITAENEGVDVRLYKVIYNAIEDVAAAMKGMLDPIFEEKIIGHAEVRQIFKSSGIGNIAGSYIMDGMFERGCKVRVTREGKQIFEGELASLKRFKDDVKEVKTGYECGLVFDGFSEIEELDQVEAYKMVEVAR